MIFYKYGKHLYDHVFEQIPRGRENAIDIHQLAEILDYSYNIAPEEEALRVIRCMQADGYIIIEEHGKFYRVAHFYELQHIYGRKFTEQADMSCFWVI